MSRKRALPYDEGTLTQPKYDHTGRLYVATILSHDLVEQTSAASQTFRIKLCHSQHHNC